MPEFHWAWADHYTVLGVPRATSEWEDPLYSGLGRFPIPAALVAAVERFSRPFPFMLIWARTGPEPGLSEHRIYKRVKSWIYCLKKRITCSCDWRDTRPGARGRDSAIDGPVLPLDLNPNPGFRLFSLFTGGHRPWRCIQRLRWGDYVEFWRFLYKTFEVCTTVST